MNTIKSLLMALAIVVICAVNSHAFAGQAHTLNGLPVSHTSNTELIKLHAGFSAFENGKVHSARTIFDSLLAENPAIPMAWVGKMLVSSSDEGFFTSIQKAKKLKTVSPAEQLLINTMEGFITNDTEARLKLSTQLVAEYPKSSMAWYIRGVILTGAKETAQAREAYEEGIKINPRHTQAHVFLANSYIFNAPKDFNKAIQVATQAAQVDANNPAVFIVLGDAYRAAGQLSKARTHYGIASAIAPESAEALTKRGHVNTFLGNYEDARADYVASTQVGDMADNRYAGNYAALTYVYEGKPQRGFDALASWLRALETSKMDGQTLRTAKLDTLWNMATIALHHGMLVEADDVLTQRESLIKAQNDDINNLDYLASQNAYNHYLRGIYALKSDKPELALEHASMLKSLVADLNDPRKLENYHLLLGRIALQKGDAQKALAHLNQADTDNIYVMYHQAKAYELQGKPQHAIKLLKAVKEYNFNNVEYALIRSAATTAYALATEKRTTEL